MNRVLLKCLHVLPLSAVVVSLSLSAASGSDVQQAGCRRHHGDDGARHAVGLPINGCATCNPHQSAGSCSTGPAAVVLAESLPPGTLGRTYQLPSRPVPADRHPCVGMIDVCCPAADHVIVRWTNDFRTEETLKGLRDECNPTLWHFESKPLLPGLTQIYRVEVYRGGPGSAPSEVRYVRLIMGRIVFLTV
ncbi:MAG: hypothetical protein AB7U20_02575 [Planctomycetaceae bacterium]